MRSLVTRRAVLFTGAAVLAAVALAGCSAGQVAETSLKRPSNQGLNIDNVDQSVVIRNLAVGYNGTAGYAAGASAPLELGIFNKTTEPVVVTISTSKPGTGAAAGTVYGASVGLTGGAATTPATSVPEPTGSRPPAEALNSQGPTESVQTPSVSPTVAPTPTAVPAAQAQPAQITLPPLGSATFLPGDKQQIQVQGLSGKLAPGLGVSLTFTFSNGADPLTVQAPMGIPLSPASRAPGVEGENSEGR